jgi:hypothetical protein
MNSGSDPCARQLTRVDRRGWVRSRGGWLLVGTATARAGMEGCGKRKVRASVLAFPVLLSCILSNGETYAQAAELSHSIHIELETLAHWLRADASGLGCAHCG